MGTCYYFWRPDNETLFDMDKASGLRDLLSKEPVKLDDLETAIGLWYADWPSRGMNADAPDLANAIKEFADGHPIFFVSEHDAVIDALYDKYGSAFYRVTYDRFREGFKK
jgi:hypothetical protein